MRYAWHPFEAKKVTSDVEMRSAVLADGHRGQTRMEGGGSRMEGRGRTPANSGGSAGERLSSRPSAARGFPPVFGIESGRIKLNQGKSRLVFFIYDAKDTDKEYGQRSAAWTGGRQRRAGTSVRPPCRTGRRSGPDWQTTP